MEWDKLSMSMGFTMTLTQNPAAMQAFAALSQAEKQNILTQAHNTHSKEESQPLAAGLINGNPK